MSMDYIHDDYHSGLMPEEIDEAKQELEVERTLEDIEQVKEEEKWLIQYISPEIKDLDSIEFTGTKQEADKLAMKECPDVPCSWTVEKIEERTCNDCGMPLEDGEDEFCRDCLNNNLIGEEYGI